MNDNSSVERCYKNHRINKNWLDKSENLNNRNFLKWKHQVTEFLLLFDIKDGDSHTQMTEVTSKIKIMGHENMKEK